MKILISTKQQKLFLYDDSEELIETFSVSTSKNGLGEEKGSHKTPRGKHEIYQKIGETEPINSVFVSRHSTGKIYSEKLAKQHPDCDWILTRILWLTGLEPGKNQLGSVDTKDRYVYIHGTPGSEPMGVPKSHGCIRMRNEDIVRLFALVGIGTVVEII